MRRFIASLVGLAALLVVVSAIGSEFLFSQTVRRPTTAEEHYHRGIALYKKYECVAAIAEFDKAINRNPQNAKYYTARAACRSRESANSIANGPDGELGEQTRTLKAVIDADLDKALMIDPQYPNAYFERAKAYSSLALRIHVEAKDAVLADFSKAIELDPNNPEFYAGRAVFYMKLDDFPRAALDFDKAVKLRPARTEYRYSRAYTSGAMGNHKLAALDLSYILGRDPKNVTARSARASHYLADGQYAKALVDYNMCLRLKPGDAVLILPERAKVYRALGKNALADADERRAKALQEKLEREFDRIVDQP